MKKEIIISFILGAIISSVVGVIAANTMSSSSVLYKDNKTVNTVLDELFENVDAIENDNTRLNTLEGKVNTLSSSHTSDVANLNNSISSLTNQHNNDITNINNYMLQVESGQLTISSYASGNGYYVKKNGWCFATLEFTPTDEALSFGVKLLASGFPTPYSNVYLGAGTAGGHNYPLLLSTDGNLYFYYNYYTQAERVDVAFTYPC